MHEGKEKSNFQVMSVRKEKKERKLTERETKERDEAQDLELSMDKLVEKHPEKRLKWLTKALLHVGRKTIKASTLYELIMDKAFLIGVDAKIGAKMKASILANGHLFSAKQQKALESPTNHFNNFATEEKKEKVKEKEKEKERSGRDLDRRGRDSDRRDREDRRDRDRDDRRDREKDSGRRREASEDRGRSDRDRRKRRREPSDSEDQSEEEHRPRKSEKAPAEAASSARAESRRGGRAEEEEDAEEQEQDNPMDPRMFAPGAADSDDE